MSPHAHRAGRASGPSNRGRDGYRATCRGRTGPRPNRPSQAPDRLQAVVLVDARKAETVAGAVESGDIFPRAEELHTAVRAAVRPEALKDLGAVVQDAGRRGHGDGPERARCARYCQPFWSV